MRARANRSDYAYADGLSGALSSKLIDRARLQRMIDAPTAEEAFRVLSDTEYAGAMADVHNPAAFERVLGREMDRIYGLLSQLAPDQFLTRIFALKFDFHNLKVIIKSRALEEQLDQLLVRRGTVAPEQFVAQVEAGEDLPEPFAAPVAAAWSAYSDTQDPQLIDIVLDGALFELLAREARRRKYGLITAYVRASIDLINVRTLLRVRRLARGPEFLARSLLKGGVISTDELTRLYAETLETVEARLASTAYARIVSEGIRLMREGRSLASLEKLSDDYLTTLARDARFIPLGPEPLFAYILAKESEIRNLRIIMAGKVNGVPAEVIRERLREAYV